MAVRGAAKRDRDAHTVIAGAAARKHEHPLRTGASCHRSPVHMCRTRMKPNLGHAYSLLTGYPFEISAGKCGRVLAPPLERGRFERETRSLFAHGPKAG